MKLSVVIPCHNEAQSVARVIQSLPEVVDEVIVVDNNSTDNTAAIARKYGAKVVFEKSKGYGRAIKTGFAHATGDIIVTLDGDGQYPCDKISEMLKHLNAHNADFISGNRFPLLPGSLSRLRIFGNKFLTFATNILFGLDLKDSQTGMWVFKKHILDEIALESNDMPMSEEFKIKVLFNPKFTFLEYDIPYHPRGGSSKLSPLKHGVMNLFFLIRLRLSGKHKPRSSQVQNRTSFLDKTSDWLRYRHITGHIPKDAKVCDVGCGANANFLHRIQPYISFGIGLDKYAKPYRDKKLEIKPMQIASRLPLAKTSVDVVTMLAFLEHVDDPQSLLKEAFRILKPGGLFIATAPTPLAKPILEFLAYRLKLIDEESIREHKTYFTRKLFYAMARRAGFKQNDIRHTYFEAFFNNLVIAKKHE